ncbi:hypothetical protein EG867_16080 [Enterococcus faecalis]|nr:hypothetical protein EG867_16080 [Enterococcus faecalis]
MDGVGGPGGSWWEVDGPEGPGGPGWELDDGGPAVVEGWGERERKREKKHGGGQYRELPLQPSPPGGDSSKVCVVVVGGGGRAGRWSRVVVVEGRERRWESGRNRFIWLPSSVPTPSLPRCHRLAGGTMTTATAWREGSQWGGRRGAEAPARGPPVRRKGQARRADAIRGARPVRAPEAGVTSGGSGRGRRDMQMRSVGTGVTSGGSCAREAVIRK